MVDGYKIFNNDMTNIYGLKFEEGKTYKSNGEVIFGTNGNGFHFCKNIEDTLRYIDAMNSLVKIAKVKSFGEYLIRNDEYNGYYDLYVASSIYIEKILTREEIINIMLNKSPYSIIRFLQGFKLANKEIELFKTKFYLSQDIRDAISFYQEKKKDTYTKKYTKK